ncbi:MAG TPA: 3-deoxy-D-manno-octulosonic acid transferase [Acetobacteraceae bacterium]|nr:3-deoxy-D-manno-octulosonic acid transferase [Acetobacteraceae bacterium]
MTRAARAWAFATSFAAPGLRLMLRRRAARGKEDPARLAERFGIDSMARPAGKLLWLHAASVGEAVSALPVLAALPAEISTLFTTGTVTSARLLAQRLPEAGLQDRVLHRFAPLDVPAWVGRFLDHWRPDAAAFLESELWPNMLAGCRARAIPVALLNARMSVRSATNWCNLRGFAAELLGGFAWVEAQSEGDAQRLRSLGAQEATAPGNLKFAAPPLVADERELARLAAVLGDRPRWLAASTHAGEETIIADIHRRLAPAYPGLTTGIVPRHPERGTAIAAALGGSGRRSLGQDPEPGLWIADTLGELGLFYRLFPAIFMGKSLLNGGGQNPLEPARLGCAVATGPATQNFNDAVAAMHRAGGLAITQDADALTAWVDRMLGDPAARTAMGKAGQVVATTQAALPAQTAARLAALVT